MSQVLIPSPHVKTCRCRAPISTPVVYLLAFMSYVDILSGAICSGAQADASAKRRCCASVCDSVEKCSLAPGNNEPSGVKGAGAANST